MLTSCTKLACRVAVLLTTVLTVGCAVGPDFAVPAAPEVDGYTKKPIAPQTAPAGAALGGTQRFVSGQDVPANWWHLFGSRGLDALVEQSLEANPNLQSQIAALRAARELVFAQQGHSYPTVQANFNPMRARSSESLSAPTNSGDFLYSLFTAQLLVSYTFDVWGQNRRAVESQQALADVQRFQTEAAYLTLTSNIVVAAIQEASLRAQIDATQKMIETGTQMVGALRRQFETGYSNRSDLAAQEAALAQVRATLPPLQKQLAMQRDLLAALAGRYPSEQPAEVFKLAAFRLPKDLPLSLPAALVGQRPDVRAAEEQLHSASALVGVAIANLLPNFTISGGRGYSSTELSSLVSPPNLFWTVAGNATHTVFDGFTLWHQERAAEATYQQAAWAYRSTVVAALQNVADALHALQSDAAALKAAQDFERAAKISLDLARQQTQAGNSNVLLLLNAQQAYLQALIQVAQAQANRLSDTAALYVALGGGWWNREGPAAPEQKLDPATSTARLVGDGGK